VVLVVVIDISVVMQTRRGRFEYARCKRRE